MDRTLKAQDTIFGALARAYIIIDGNREEMFYAKNIEAKIDKKKVEVPVLGRTGVKHKAGGWSGKGKMTMYYCTSLFRKMMLKYIKEGIDTYFDMVLENEDPTSGIGKQTEMLKGVNIDNVIIALIDIEKESLDEDVDFTFNDVDQLEEFSQIIPE